MGDRSFYQTVRTVVKQQLNHLVNLVGMEPDIRVTTPHPIDDAEAALREVLADRGYQVLSVVDVQEIHHHYNLEYPEYRILCIGDPDTAGDALHLDAGTSAFLPVSVVLYELDGETHVSAIRPSTLLALFTHPALQAVIQTLEQDLWDALVDGVPDSTVVSEEQPLPPDTAETRATIKRRLNLLLAVVDAEYSIHVSTDTPLPEVERPLRKALKSRGQHVLGEVTVDDDYRTLLVANPGQAHKALAIEPDVGVFAPLSVSLYRTGDRTHVRTVRPSTLLIFYTNPALQSILLEMEMLLWNGVAAGVPDTRVHSRQPPLPPGTGQRTTAAGLPGGLGSLRRFRPG